MDAKEKILNIAHDVCLRCKVEYAGGIVIIWAESDVYLKLGAARADYQEIIKNIKNAGYSIDYEECDSPDEDDYSWTIEVSV